MAKKTREIDKKELKRFFILIDKGIVSTTIETSNGIVNIEFQKDDPSHDVQTIEDAVHELIRMAYEQGKIDFKKQLRRMVF